MEIIHNSQDLTYRSPFGACKIGSSVNLMIFAQNAVSVQLRLWREGYNEQLINLEQQNSRFSVCLKLPEEPCVLFYYFIIRTAENTIYYGNAVDSMGGVGHIYDYEPISYQITVYKPAPIPEWYKNAIVYQIFPDRFARSSSFDPDNFGTLPDVRGGVLRCVEKDWEKVPVNEFYPDKNEICRWKFYGGSLDGIREKLGYLKSLGVTAIYLNPIFKARSTHRYDTADYMMIDPMLGNEKSFTDLAKEARSQGIRIILDGVFNHCGADSSYFDFYNQYHKEGGEKGAYKYKTSPFRSWFTFTDEPPYYRCWWGIPDMPDFDTSNKDYVKFITGENGVIKKWLRLGASGWRLDVADELPNEFLKKIRTSVKSEGEDNLLMGEVWDDPTNKYNYGHLMEYFWGEELDTTMNYPFRLAVLPFVIGNESAYDFCRKFMNLAENYPKENFYGSLNLLGSHDRERVMNILGGYPIAKYGADRETSYHDLTAEQYDLARKRYKMLSILQYALPGVPEIYYGDEAGVQGGADPDCRRTYPWGKEDEDLVKHFQWLGKYYHEHSCLQNGDFELTPLTDDVLALERFNEKEHLLLLINRSDQYRDVFYKGQTYNLWPFDAKIL